MNSATSWKSAIAEVTVVIPSFNRAHLLKRTIPSYVQPSVGEIIIVDDASTDDTTSVIRELQKQYPLIRYIRLAENHRQMYAKNKGIENACYPFIYFGDDDSFITDDSIPLLLNEAKERNADIVGAKALYMQTDADLKDVSGFIRSFDHVASSSTDIANLSTLKFNFTLSADHVIETPVTQACFLIRTELAREILFDEKYLFNAYREETDFLIRANLAGARIFYQPKAIQINLPRSLASGGAHSGGKVLWLLACVYNNWYFLRKNYPMVRKKYRISRSIFELQCMFVIRGIWKMFTKMILM
jgi:glycosyltransferase involved in cell wall biosynthesis